MLNLGGDKRRDSSLGRSASLKGRRSGEIIEEEDEDEELVEEVDHFSPVDARMGEVAEEEDMFGVGLSNGKST